MVLKWEREDMTIEKCLSQCYVQVVFVVVIPCFRSIHALHYVLTHEFIQLTFDCELFVET